MSYLAGRQAPAQPCLRRRHFHLLSAFHLTAGQVAAVIQSTSIRTTSTKDRDSERRAICRTLVSCRCTLQYNRYLSLHPSIARSIGLLSPSTSIYPSLSLSSSSRVLRRPQASCYHRHHRHHHIPRQGQDGMGRDKTRQVTFSCPVKHEKVIMAVDGWI